MVWEMSGRCKTPLLWVAARLEAKAFPASGSEPHCF